MNNSARHAPFHPALVSTLLLLLVPGAVHALTPDELVRKADEGRMPQLSLVFTATVRESGSGPAKETRYEVSSKPQGKDAYSLAVTRFPERLAGRKLLMRGNDLWLYLPTLKRPTRISFRERLTGEVSNGDISRTNFSGDYKAVQTGTESVGGRACIRLGLTAVSKDVTYSRIDYWIDARSYLPVKAAFYALSGKLLKTGEYSGMKTVLGAPRMTQLTIRDALQPSRQSVVIFSAFRSQELPDELFNKESLSE